MTLETNPYAAPGGEAGAGPLSPPASVWTAGRLNALALIAWLSFPLYVVGIALLFTADIGWSFASLAGGLLAIGATVAGLLGGAIVLWRGDWRRRLIVAPPLALLFWQQFQPLLHLLRLT